MKHTHKWVETMWHLVNPYGSCNQPNKYLGLEICWICGNIRVVPHDRKRIEEGMEEET